jgi:hypothetical protein
MLSVGEGQMVKMSRSIADVWVSNSDVADVHVTNARQLNLFGKANGEATVIATAWSGMLDYLGPDGPGHVPYALVPAPLWPTARPTFFPSQRWAQADLDAAAARLRAFVADPAPFHAHGTAVRERLVEMHAEPIVARAWLAALARTVQP